MYRVVRGTTACEVFFTAFYVYDGTDRSYRRMSLLNAACQMSRAGSATGAMRSPTAFSNFTFLFVKRGTCAIYHIILGIPPAVMVVIEVQVGYALLTTIEFDGR